MKPVRIGTRKIGPGHPCYIIAEAGVNHNGDVSRAKKMIRAAKNAGADAVKFQTFRAANLVTRSAKKAAYQCRTTDPGEAQYQMLKKLELSAGEFGQLAAYAGRAGIEFLSSPFDRGSVDLLESLNVAAYKIPSGELTNIPLLRYIAGCKKPVILSTGMAGMDEIREALATLSGAGVREIVLLHCITSYPAPPETLNLRMIPTLRETFGVPVGFSDHSEGILGSLLARALGACLIEKHFTLDRALPGPDHAASLEPAELAGLVRQVQTTDRILGSGERVIGRTEAAIKKVARKSLVAETDIKKGSELTEDKVGIKRPGTGIAPKFISEVVGRTACRNIRKDSVITWDMLS